MKNSNLIYGICLAGTVIFAASVPSSFVFGQEQVLEATSPPQDSVVINDEEKQFVTEAIQMNFQDIALAKLAQGKDLPPYAASLADMIEEDHMESMADLSELANSKNIPLENPETTEMSQELQQLDSLDGNEFGMVYSKLLVNKHEEAIEKFEKASTDSVDPEIKAWAKERLPVLNAHLEAAKECVMQCEKGTDSPKKDI